MRATHPRLRCLTIKNLIIMFIALLAMCSQALLDEEMEARRRRVAKWQAERQQQKEAELQAQQAAAAGVEAAAVLAAAQEAAAQLGMGQGGEGAGEAGADAGKGWSLEDDSD